MKTCPKCNNIHSKDGTFCSRSCANSRGPRSLEFKNIAISYWKNQLYPRFQKNALEGKTKYDIIDCNFS